MVLMSNPIVHAFFVGRAVAELVYEQAEHALTDALSELGKFDAEQRERLRQFTAQVLERASREEEATMRARTTTAIVPLDNEPTDLQAMIDDLRAEIARLRTELKRYRNQVS
jgi:polyhydroxyalkanoate synthesis regulator phasin